MLSDTDMLERHGISEARLKTLQAALDKSDSSWFALARACAFSSQLELLKHFYQIDGLHESHVLGLIPSAYHLSTAPGAFRNMVESQEEQLVLTCLAYSCTMKALPFLVNALAETRAMRTALPSQDEESTTDESEDDEERPRPLDDKGREVMDATERWLQRAIDDAVASVRLLEKFTGPRRWSIVVKEAAAREKRAVKVRRCKGLQTSSAIGPKAIGLPAFELQV